MRKSVTVIAIVSTILALGAAAWAANPRGLPHRYAPRSLDGNLTQVTNAADGATLAVWAYRSGAEYDIAISRTDADGRWSEPVFLGQDDGRDQVQPSVTLDNAGNAYLAYTDRGDRSVKLTVLRAGAETWSVPVALTLPELEASSPSLLVVGSSLVVAYRVGSQTAMKELRLDTPEGGWGSLSIVDNPDPVEYQPTPEDGNPLDRWGPQGIWVIGEDGQPVDILLLERKGTQNSQPPG